MRRALVMALMCALHGSGHASEPRRVSAGDPAPFDGYVVSIPYHAQLLRDRATSRKRAGELRKLAASLRAKEGVLQAERAANEATVMEFEQREAAFKSSISKLEKTLEDAASPTPWYASPEFLVPTTALVTAVVVVVLVR